jgi:hypothetical protein
MFRAAVMVVVVLAVACDDLSAPCTGGRCSSAQTRFTYAEPRASEVDIVVVMDDSPSMAGKRARALDALRGAFDRTFAAIPGGSDLDLQIRVISSTANGACGKAGAPDCALPPGGVLTTSPICGAQPNFDGSTGAAIACAARFPDTGCGVEQPLASLKAHLEQAPKRRPGGFLFVLIVTDEDDCSSARTLPFDPSGADGPDTTQRCRDADAAGTLDPVSSYVSFLWGFSEGRPPSVAVVAPVSHACGGRGRDADPPLRLQRFAEAFGGGGSVTDFCAADWSSATSVLSRRLGVLIGVPCLPGGLVDRDSVAPGIQPDCVVTQHPPDEQPRSIPPCAGADGVCWRAEKSLSCIDSGYQLTIDHRSCFSPAGTWLEITCATKP